MAGSRKTAVETTCLTIDPESIRLLIAPIVDLQSQAIELTRSQLREVEERRQQNHAENSKRRHDLGGVVGHHGDALLLLGGRMDGHDAAIRSMIGDGAGQGGVLNELRRGQESMRSESAAQSAEILAKMAGIEERGIAAKATGEKVRELEDWKANWAGVAKAMGLLVTFLTVMSLLLGGAWWLFSHARG